MSSGFIGSLTQNIHGGQGGAGGASSGGAGGTGRVGEGLQIRFERVENVFVNDQSHTKLREWLNPADVSQNQRAAEDRHHSGTVTWRADGFLISGLWKDCPQKLRDNGDTVTYFYFDTTNDRKQKAEDLLRTLISRLSDSASHAASILESFWKFHANGAEAPSNQTLLEILIKILSGFATPVYIIVDAKIHNIQVVLTSRTEVTYGNELFSTATVVCLKGSGVTEDITLYLGHILATDKDFKCWSHDIKDDVCKSLLNGPDLMFRLVALQLDQLRNCLCESDIAPALAKMPSTMNNIYDLILENIQSKVLLAMVNQTLNWLIFSMEPVTLGQITDALAVDFDQSPARFNPKKRLTAPSKLVDACAGLVSQTEDTENGTTILQLAHASVKEYLTDPERSSHALQAEISNDVGHYMLARTCIAYLCSFDNYDVLETSPLGLYAAENWHHHVNRYNPGSKKLPTPHAPKRKPKYWLVAVILRLLKAIQLISKRLSSAGDIDKQPQQCDQSDLVTALIDLLQAGSVQYSNLLQLLREDDDIPPIVFSASHSVLPAVQMLLDRGADINVQGGYYGNALQDACDQENTEIVQMLLDRGADVNSQGGKYGNALQVACDRENTEIVQMLLGRGADVNAQGGYYGNALQAACTGANTEIVQMLLDRGAEVTAQGYYGNALQAACYMGNTEIVQMLLDRGAYVNAPGGRYGNALRAARHSGIVQLLLKNGADFEGSDLQNTDNIRDESV
ncbi:ankyrin repeat-containing domain protein [Mycena sanguinolenta]|nr:ankyrin repeat-containing domain protein [Mycena sanguinolenta]